MNIKNILAQPITISFIHTTGESRHILSAEVQKRLFDLGYTWLASGKKTQNFHSECLHIGSSEWNPYEITHSSHEYVLRDHGDGKVLVYDAATELNEFLAKASEIRTSFEYQEIIDGVTVTLTRNNITFDSTAFFEKLGTKAKRLQKEIFP